MTPRVAILFSGADGWGEGLNMLGIHDTIGLEFDRDACLTATAAGHPTVRADVTDYPMDRFAGIEGLIASPPCTDFSTAGKQRGVDGETGGLIWEIPRWVDWLRPRWVACEQVPPVLPYFQGIADDMETYGYRTWCGILNAADYGVPQTRKRAFLLASRDFQPGPPEATHAKRPEPTLMGELLPWVSMAEALGWGMTERPTCTVTAGSNRQGGPCPLDGGSGAREVLRRERERGAWVVRTGANSMKHSRDPDEIERYERSVDEPAPTVDAKAGGAWTLDRRQKGAPTLDPMEVPSPTVVGSALGKGVWTVTRPATTIVGSFRPDIVAAPGWRTAGSGPRQNAEGSVKITVQDALTLQSFRPDYPLHGSRTSQFRQVGNAVPPRLAMHMLAQFVRDTP